jgi:AMMECR1 domain-containing protein/aromatic ring-opening dioxygenase LigB subunit
MEKRIAFAGLMPHAPILVPGVGGDNLAKVEATARAMKTVARHALAARPESIVVISPHSPRRSGSFGIWRLARVRGSMSQFGSPQEGVDLPFDRKFADRLEVEAGLRGLKTWGITDEELDHGALVPLCYLASQGWDGPTVVVGLDYPDEGGLDELGQAIAATAAGLRRRTAVIASGDMSHRLVPAAPAGYDPEAHRFDEEFVGLLRRGEFGELRHINPILQERAAEDVMDPTRVALAASGLTAAGHHEVLSYEGPFGVGYCVAILFERGSAGAPRGAKAEEAARAVSRPEELPEVARCAAEACIRNGRSSPPWRAAGVLAQKGAVFVTVETDAGVLRGCVGAMVGRETDLVAETRRNAASAVLRDPRFAPVSADELAHLRYTVTLIGKREEVASAQQLDPAAYGVLVTARDGRSGVLLPALEGIDTAQEQLSVALRKAGIAPDEPFRIERFTATAYGEKPAGQKGGQGDDG